MKEQLDSMREFYEGYNTRDYTFRKRQLQLLKAGILKHEKSLINALHSDLKKNPEESWITEIGFVIAEINHCLKHLRKWMQPARVPTNLINLPGKSRIYKEPLGVVLVIGPWNYPMQLLFTPLVGAMAAGNCVVLKPSEFAPATNAVMKQVVQENFPNNYILFIEGEGSTVIPEMMQNFGFDHVFFTGSAGVGKSIYQMAANQLTPVTLELGGKSPCVVESDANIVVAARRIAQTKFSNAGQMCVAPDYILVHESVKDKLVVALSSSIKQFYSDDPSSSDNYGKIISNQQFRRIIGYLNNGSIIYGGKHDASALYIEPTLIDDAGLETSLMQEEIFGPVLPIKTFRSFDEAKKVIERNANPLAFYLFTESHEKERQWLEKISFGGGCVNNTSWHLTNFNLPFGGRGTSGIGSYHGQYSFDLFSHRKSILKTPTWFDPDIKYPPYKGKLNLLKMIIR